MRPGLVTLATLVSFAAMVSIIVRPRFDIRSPFDCREYWVWIGQGLDRGLWGFNVGRECDRPPDGAEQYDTGAWAVRCGFGFLWRRWRGLSNVNLQVWVPLPVIALPACTVLFVCTRRQALRWRTARLANRRIQSGHCRDCGYDIRASPDRCPECGAATPIALPKELPA